MNDIKTVFRSNAKTDYTCLKNTTIRKTFNGSPNSARLAKIIFLESLTHGPHKIFTIKNLSRRHHVSEKIMRSALNIIIKSGHAKRVRSQDPKTGKIAMIQYSFYEEKIRKSHPKIKCVSNHHIAENRHMDNDAQTAVMTTDIHRHEKQDSAFIHMAEKGHMDKSPGTPADRETSRKNHIAQNRHMDTYLIESTRKENNNRGQAPAENVVVVSQFLEKIKPTFRSDCSPIISEAMARLTDEKIRDTIDYINRLDDEKPRVNYPGAIRDALKGDGYKTLPIALPKPKTDSERSQEAAERRKEELSKTDTTETERERILSPTEYNKNIKLLKQRIKKQKKLTIKEKNYQPSTNPIDSLSTSELYSLNAYTENKIIADEIKPFTHWLKQHGEKRRRAIETMRLDYLEQWKQERRLIECHPQSGHLQNYEEAISV